MSTILDINSMAKVKRTLFRFPYLGVLLVILVLVLIFLVERKVTPYVKEPNLSIQTPVLQTKVVMFRPDVPAESKEGSCFANSVMSNSKDAWRCTVGNQIYDPCIVATDGKTLVCGVDPSKNTPGFSLTLITPLPTPEVSEDMVNNPWILETASGRLCSFAQGASGVVDDVRINYYCESTNETSDAVIVGDLKQGKLWNAKRVVLAKNEPTLTILQEGIVPLKTVWLVE